MHIEIIDDNIQLSGHIKKSFEKKWNTVNTYSSRDEFLHNSKFTNTDLYIMDINLWDGNGLDLIEHLRVVEKLITPIIIISGQTSEETKLEWFELWADDFLEKPFSVQELYARIESIFHRIDIAKAKLAEEEKSKINICFSEEEKSKMFSKEK